MRLMLLVSLLVLLPASVARPQVFGPKNYAECIMLYAKKAQSRDAAMLMRRACKCRYQEMGSPECAQYSQAALNCMVDNLRAVDADEAAWGVERACRTKHPVGK